MSATYGYLTGNRGTVTRCGSARSGITARLKTWCTEATCLLNVRHELVILTYGPIKAIVINGQCVRFPKRP